MSLVRKLGINIVCDTYMCRNMAEVQIGHEVMPATAVHLCADCFKQIIKEGADLFPEMKPEPEIIEVEKKPEQEYYECRFCGEKFLKPDELKQYRAHALNCRKRI